MSFLYYFSYSYDLSVTIGLLHFSLSRLDLSQLIFLRLSTFRCSPSQWGFIQFRFCPQERHPFVRFRSLAIDWCNGGYLPDLLHRSNIWIYRGTSHNIRVLKRPALGTTSSPYALYAATLYRFGIICASVFWIVPHIKRRNILNCNNYITNNPYTLPLTIAPSLKNCLYTICKSERQKCNYYWFSPCFFLCEINCYWKIFAY